MDKTEIQAHPSVMFIYSALDRGEVMLGGYDGGYPRIIYASAPNLLGGNPEQADKVNGPYDVLKQEVEEEISIGEKNVDWKGRQIKWASLEDVLRIRNAVLDNARPYADFLVDADGIMVKPRDRPEKVRMSDIYMAIYSSFRAEIPEDIFECASDNIKAGKRFCTEGFIGVHTLKQLELAGEFSTAHATAPILNSYFGTNIPYPEQIKVLKIGDPRKFYSQYSEDFPHAEAVWGSK